MQLGNIRPMLCFVGAGKYNWHWNNFFEKTKAGMAETIKDEALIASWRGVYPREDFSHVFVIGLAGFAGSGKTTVAERIIDDCNHDEEMPAGLRLSFAQRLKKVLAALVGDEAMSFDEPQQKLARLYGDSDWDVRKFFTTFATEFCRDQIGADLWVDIIAGRLNRLREPTVVVIDDLRYPNEFGLVKALGQAVLLRRQGVGRTIKHSSEEPNKLAIETIIDIERNMTPPQVGRIILELVQKHEFWPPAAKQE